MSIRGRIIFLGIFGIIWILMGCLSLQKVSANPWLKFAVGGFMLIAALVLAMRTRTR